MKLSTLAISEKEFGKLLEANGLIRNSGNGVGECNYLNAKRIINNLNVSPNEYDRLIAWTKEYLKI